MIPTHDKPSSFSLELTQDTSSMFFFYLEGLPFNILDRRARHSLNRGEHFSSWT